MKTVKVKAYKKLSPTGKIENVDAHMRKVESSAATKTPRYAKGNKMIYKPTGEVATIINNYGNPHKGDRGEVRTDLEGNVSIKNLKRIIK